MDVATFLWMFLVLKIPIVAALILIWYAVREPEPVVDDEDGGSRVPHGPSPRPDRPRPPRRGPHAVAPAPSPDRVRMPRGRPRRRPAGR